MNHLLDIYIKQGRLLFFFLIYHKHNSVLLLLLYLLKMIIEVVFWIVTQPFWNLKAHIIFHSSEIKCAYLNPSLVQVLFKWTFNVFWIFKTYHLLKY